jgi:hypothetical protein
MTKQTWTIAAVGVIAILGGLLYFLYSHHRFPFGGADQPIIISDSTVDVRINGTLDSGDNNSHRIPGKFHHVIMMDKNGTPSSVCTNGLCDKTVVTFQIANDIAYHTITVREVPNSDATDLVVDSPPWNTNFWNKLVSGNYTTLELQGRLVDSNRVPCPHCAYYLCYSNSDTVEPNCAEKAAR